MKRAIPLSSLLLAALCACGGASSPAQAPAHTPTDATDSERLAEIESLAAELRDLKGTLYHARHERCIVIRPEQWTLDEDPDPLAEEVCGNRDRTCALAGHVHDNAWADGKCDDARRACREARAICTRVTARPHTF